MLTCFLQTLQGIKNVQNSDQQVDELQTADEILVSDCVSIVGIKSDQQNMLN